LGRAKFSSRNKKVLAGIFLVSMILSFQNCNRSKTVAIYDSESLKAESLCVFNNKEIIEGKSVWAFKTRTVSAGQICESEKRVCQEGNLTGRYPYSTCKAEQKTDLEDYNPASGSPKLPARELWLEPSLYSVDTYNLNLQSEHDWAQTLNKLDILSLDYTYLLNARSQQLEELAEVLQKNQVRLNFNTQGVYEQICRSTNLLNLGKAAARYHFGILKKIFLAGGEIHSITLKSPMKRILYVSPCRERFHATPEEAAQETVNYMIELVRWFRSEGQKDPIFHLNVSFSEWDYNSLPRTNAASTNSPSGDYKEIFETLQKEVAARGLSFESLLVDNGGRSTGEREKLLFQQANSENLKVIPHINSLADTISAPADPAQQPCATSIPSEECVYFFRDWRPPDDLREQNWLSAALDYLASWTASTEEIPQGIVVGSWMLHPRNILSEKTFGTLSYDFLKISEALMGPSASGMFQNQSAPKGEVNFFVDSKGNATLSGWGYDPDESSTSIYIHIYRNGKIFRSILTNQLRLDVNSSQGISGLHGFSWSLPEKIDPGPEEWRVYVPNYNRQKAELSARPSVELTRTPFVR